MNEDGTMARLPQLIKVAEKFNLKLVSIEDLVAYRMRHDSLVLKREDTEIMTKFGEFRLRAFQQTTNDQVHIALTKGSWAKDEAILTRINSSQISNDLLGTLTGLNDKGLEEIFKLINTEEKGAIIFINQQQQSENLLARIKELKASDKVKNTVAKAPPLKMDIKILVLGLKFFMNCILVNYA